MIDFDGAHVPSRSIRLRAARFIPPKKPKKPCINTASNVAVELFVIPSKSSVVVCKAADGTVHVNHDIVYIERLRLFKSGDCYISYDLVKSSFGGANLCDLSLI